MRERTARRAALGRAPAGADDLDEARMVTAWAAANDAPVLELEGGVSGARLRRFLRGAGVDVDRAAGRRRRVAAASAA